MYGLKIIPALDVMNGQVVRGVGGRRKEYRPLQSRLTTSTEPAEVAQVIKDLLGLEEVYVAELDAIVGRSPHLDKLESLVRAGFQVWLDAGVREVEEVERWTQLGVAKCVLGLETMGGPHVLEAATQAVGADRIVFSLDLKAGELLGDRTVWPIWEPLSLAREARARGVRQMLVLDLAQVGLRRGLGTEDLCRRILEEMPDVKLFAGGGIRDLADLKRLSELGISGALVASLLHDADFRELNALAPKPPG